jgi:hypothetical protein
MTPYEFGLITASGCAILGAVCRVITFADTVRCGLSFFKSWHLRKRWFWIGAISNFGNLMMSLTGAILVLCIIALLALLEVHP